MSGRVLDDEELGWAFLFGLILLIYLYEINPIYCGLIIAVGLILLLWDDLPKPKNKSTNGNAVEPDFVPSEDSETSTLNVDGIVDGDELSWQEFNSIFSKTAFKYELGNIEKIVPKSKKNVTNKSLLWSRYREANDSLSRQRAVKDWSNSIMKEKPSNSRIGDFLTWSEFNSIFSKYDFKYEFGDTEKIIPKSKKNVRNKSLLWQRYKQGSTKNSRLKIVEDWSNEIMEVEGNIIGEIIDNIKIWPDGDSHEFLLKELTSERATYVKKIREEISKRGPEISDFERNYKSEAFKKTNFQQGHRNPSVAQKEKLWKETENKTTRIPYRSPHQLSITYKYCNLCNKNPALSFWWTIHPELRLLLICQSCAENEGLVEEKQITESRSRNISQEVRDTVWNRDGGKCVECGSKENLEFDHIIPHSKGGANTYRNIQLLCEKCNRSKSDNIG